MKPCTIGQTIHQGCDIVVNHLRGRNLGLFYSKGTQRRRAVWKNGVNMSIIYDWLLVYSIIYDWLLVYLHISF